MSSGSWDSSYYIPGVVRYTSFKTWSGDDRPKLPRGEVRNWTVFRSGKTYHFRYRTFSAPKRVKDSPHNYSVSGGLVVGNWYVANHTDFGDQLGLVSEFINNTSHDNFLSYQTSQFDANDQLRLVAKLREKIFGSDFNASVFLGEGHQTLDLIADSAKRIYTSLRHLRRGNIRGATKALVEGTPRGPHKPYDQLPTGKSVGRALSPKEARRNNIKNAKAMSSNWLELQYGWLPLLSDAEGAAQALAKSLEVPFSMRYSASIFRGVETVRTGGAGVTAYQWTLHTVCRRKLVVYMTEKPSLAAQLGVLNPENVAWELLPWSFVVDWFIPIGQYLDARAISSCVAGTYVTSDKTLGWIDSFGGARMDPRAQDYKAVYRFYNRTVSTSPSLPLPKFKGIGKAASWQHCTNAVALLTGMLKRPSLDKPTPRNRDFIGWDTLHHS